MTTNETNPSDSQTANPRLKSFANSAFYFVLTLGVVNLFSDMTYEGGAAINGQFLASLGASAFAISLIAGFGEFLGYTLRSVAGYLADRTGRYWLITFIGYSLNLLAVPLMAFAGNWQWAALFLLLERVGRAFRKPTVEAMLSYSTGKHGRGWVYSLNTAMDETGAALGPLLVGAALFAGANLRTSFSLLLLPSILALVALTFARVIFPVPSKLEEGGPPTAVNQSFTPAYWLYMIGGSLFAMGIMSFEFIAFHLSTSKTVSDPWIPWFLALATVGSVGASLLLGRLYDRLGFGVMLAAVLISASFSPLVFFGGFEVALVGLLLWGVGYATQDTMLKVLIASVLPKGKRNAAFGVFYLGYGAGWLLGGLLAGLLYEQSRVGLVIFAMGSQLLSIPFFVLGSRAAIKRGEPDLS